MACLATLVSVACSSTEPGTKASTDQALRATTWGSDQASLVIVGNTATLHVLASGGCYGSSGEIAQAIPNSTFTLSGTYTQLMGAYPGYVRSVADYSGSVAGDTMTLRISLPSQQRTVGPFRLTARIAASWPPCLYP
ncbi:MAG: hypothetical protein ABJE47_06870 [bacterium]